MKRHLDNSKTTSNFISREMQDAPNSLANKRLRENNHGTLGQMESYSPVHDDVKIEEFGVSAGASAGEVETGVTAGATTNTQNSKKRFPKKAKVQDINLIELKYQKYDLLYSDPSSVSTKYSTDSSSGEISIEQIIKGRNDIFISRTPKTTLKRKKIIISDWFFSHTPTDTQYFEIDYFTSEEIRSKKIDFYLQLQRDGFELYAYINGTLKEINDLEELNFIQFTSIEEIQEEITRRGFTYNETFRAGPFESLYFAGLDYITTIKQLIHFTPEFCNKFIPELVNRKFCNFRVIINQPLSNIMLTEEQYKIWQFVDKLKFLYENTSLPMPTTLQELDLSGAVFETEELKTLLSNCKNLKTLDLENYEAIEDITLPPTLQELNIPDAFLNSDELPILLQNIFNLRKLTLNSFTSSEAVQNSSAFPTTLKELITHEMKFGSTELDSVIGECINLKKLVLSQASEFHLLEKLTLPSSIEELDLSSSSISTDLLNSILPGFTHLKKLNLSKCKELENLVTLNFPSSIEELNLSATKVSTSDLESILPRFTHLKKLNLSKCKELKDLDTLELPSSIKELDLSQTNISSSDLESLLNNCINLYVLNLINCGNLGNSKALVFPTSVKKINLSNSNISLEELKDLYIYCPSLNVLNLANCKNLGKANGINLPYSLQRLDLSDTDTSFAKLNSLISKCKIIQQLSLNNCRNLGMIGKLILPRSIQQLIISNTDITYLSLNIIMSMCPNATINVADCSNIAKTRESLAIPSTVDLFGHEDNETNSPLFEEEMDDILPFEDEIDGDTMHKEEISFEAMQIFKPKPLGIQDIMPNNYRLIVEPSKSELALESFIRIEDFEIVNDLEALYNASHHDNAEIFLGKKDFPSTGGTYALPSIKPWESLLKIECNPLQRCIIFYSQITNLYYITLEASPTSYSGITVKFLLHVPHQAPSLVLNSDLERSSELYNGSASHQTSKSLTKLKFNSENKLNADWLYSESEADKIRLLTEYCRNFKEKELENDDLSSILNLIMEQQAGVCRHRAKCFVIAAEELGIKTRLIKNDIHHWVEVYYHDKWNIIDLGGAENLSLNIFNRWRNSILSVEENISSYEQKNLLSGSAIKPVSLSIDEYESERTILADNPFYIDPLKIEVESMKEYFDSIMEKMSDTDNRNILCIMNAKQIEDFHHVVMQNGLPSYFISNLDDISLTETIIKNDAVCSIDSKLAKFLQIGNGLLLIDWSECKPQHIGLNSIIDAKRMIEKQAIAENIIVISILEHGVLMGDDFYSRQHTTYIVPDFSPLPDVDTDPVILMDEDDEYQEIVFYNDDWRNKIYGKITLKEEGISFEESDLIKHINTGNTNIVLINAPWHDKDFRLAINEIKITGLIYANGREYRCPSILFKKKQIPYNVSCLRGENFNLDSGYQLLNSITFNHVFEQYQIVDGKLITKDITTLPLLVTENLEEAAWAKLANIKRGISIVLVKGVTGPNTELDSVLKAHLQSGIIQTNDLAMSLKEFDTGQLIIHINDETKLSDLIEKICFEPTTLTFSHKICVLANALIAERDVVLAGNPSPHLLKGLESLLINKPYMMVNGERTTFKGKLTIIAENIEVPGIFDKVQQIFTEDKIWTRLKTECISEVDLNNCDKLRSLCQALQAMVQDLESFNYTQLKTMLQRMRINPHSNPFKSILRLRADYERLKPSIEGLWNSHHEPTTKTVKSRLDKVTAELEHSPYVFLVGPSGVGKSRFVQKELSVVYEVFEGMDLVSKLTEKSGDGRPRLLFIDEANLSSTTSCYEIFRGLLDGSDKIPIDGTLQKIAEGNKILFAGNYGYFKGRNRIRLVEEYGSIISFKELSDETIKSEIIKSTLSLFTISYSRDLDIITDVILESYHKINTAMPERHPLTVRNLQMICLRFGLLSGKISNLKLSAAIAIYDEIYSLLGKNERREFKTWLESKLLVTPIKNTKADLKKDVSIEGEVVTRSRQNLVRLLDNLLSIRDLKTGLGLNGFLIEGPSGIGKSYIVKKFLESRGFNDGELDNTAPNKYYLITPTNYERAKKILELAFEEGAIVIIDEINTMPLENILNPLLSGVNLMGGESANKGFMVIATQNPISFSNRIAFSDALNNRFLKIFLKDYDKKELLELFTPKGARTENWIERLAEDFNVAKIWAKRDNVIPPNSRQFIAKVKNEHMALFV